MEIVNQEEMAPGAAKREEREPIIVACRFYREELDELRVETGANADATAVVCFVRRGLRSMRQPAATGAAATSAAMEAAQ